jgi:hypothetical protein
MTKDAPVKTMSEDCSKKRCASDDLSITGDVPDMTSGVASREEGVEV